MSWLEDKCPNPFWVHIILIYFIRRIVVNNNDATQLSYRPRPDADVMSNSSLKLKFHGTDTDTDTDILADFRTRIVARMSVRDARV